MTSSAFFILLSLKYFVSSAHRWQYLLGFSEDELLTVLGPPVTFPGPVLPAGYHYGLLGAQIASTVPVVLPCLHIPAFRPNRHTQDRCSCLCKLSVYSDGAFSNATRVGASHSCSPLSIYYVCNCYFIKTIHSMPVFPATDGRHRQLCWLCSPRLLKLLSPIYCPTQPHLHFSTGLRFPALSNQGDLPIPTHGALLLETPWGSVNGNLGLCPTSLMTPFCGTCSAL